MRKKPLKVVKPQPAPRRAPEPAPGIRIGVASRPGLYRQVLCRALASVDQFAVAGEAWDEESVAALLAKEAPKILLFDYEALGPSGESVIAKLRTMSPQTRILVIATRSGDDTAERVLRSGASGLLPKESDFDTLVRAVRAVAAGELWANRIVTAQALERLTGVSSRDGATDGRLTRREADVVAAVALGLRNKEVARKLGISEQTVKSHVNNVLRKLHLQSRMALALYELKRDQPKV